MKNLNSRVVVPIAVLCSLLGGCVSGGGKAATAPKAEPQAELQAEAAVEAPKPAAKSPSPTQASETAKTAQKKVAKKPAPQPQPAFEINTPQEPFVDQPPPPQPRKAEPPKPEISKPEIAKPESPQPQPQPQPPAAAAPPLDKQPDAIAILERAREKLAQVRTLDCVSLTEATGDAAKGIPGLGVRNRVQLRFEYGDAVSVPFFVISRITETPNGELVGPRAIYDGTRAVIVDDATRTFVDPGRNWFDVVGPNLASIPQWYFKERMTLARRKPGANLAGAGSIEPQMIGARILGVEQFDGKECDVVEFYYSKDIVQFSEKTGKPEVVDEQRYTDTIYFARADGLPRKVVMREVPHPSAPPGSGSTITMQYLRMVVNPGYEASFFETSIPNGYLPQEQR